MEGSGEASTEASSDRWMKRRLREQQFQHDDAQNVHSVTDERAKALLEYRARCTSARFWIQSELLDLRVGCTSPSSRSASSDNQQSASLASTGSDGDKNKGSDPGVVGDLPSLMKRYLTCPLLLKLLQQDPVLSGKLATLDHVLWHRRSKHERQTSGWMSHDPLCPEGCSFTALPTLQTGAEASAAAAAAGMCGASNGSSRTSTVDSMAGGEMLPGPAPSVSYPGRHSRPTGTAEDEGRPVTAWVSCERCMEHFAYIAASLLVFLKPSELRDLAVERQQSQCCGFVFCGRRNVSTPEKRRAALWRWTLDFGGSKALSEDELVQFCCSRCCNRQQQLLRLLDEEPMYARPGIKEWIGDALQRKAAYRPHPHCLTKEDTLPTVVSPRTQHEGQQDSSTAGASRGVDLQGEQSAHEGKLAAPVEMEVLLREGPERLEANRLLGPPFEKRSTGVSCSTESSSGELIQLGSRLHAEGFSVPLTVEYDGESSADETPVKEAKNEDYPGILTAGDKDVVSAQGSALSMGREDEEALNNNFLMLNYSSTTSANDRHDVTSSASDRTACDASLSGAVCGVEAARMGSGSVLGKALITASASGALPSVDRNVEATSPETQQRRGEASPSEVTGTACQAEPPIKSRGSRVRFADDDGEEGDEADGGTDSVSASVFKHFFNMQDEDDGPDFYTRLDRQAAPSANAPGSQTRNGIGELRSILKPATEPVDLSPQPASSIAEAQMGYMRLSDVVIAFDLLSSCCTDGSARFLARYHRRFCTCCCEGAVPTAASTGIQQAEGDESPKLASEAVDGGTRGVRSRKNNEADESDSVSCMDGESGDEIEPSELWQRRQQQLLKAILRSLPPSADSFAPLVTELCGTFQPLQPLPTLRCSLCSCLAAVLLLLLLLLRARPLTCCCCCDGCRPWSNSHERHSRCQRRQPPGAVHGKAEGSEIADVSASFYFDDALTLAREEDVGLALVDFVRSTIQQSAPCSSPVRPLCGTSDAPSAAEPPETPAHHQEEKALHVLLESIFSRMTLPIVQMCEVPRLPSAPPQ